MSQEKSTNQIGHKIREVDERIIKMKQEREILSTYNSICNLRELVNETHKNLSIDLPVCEKIEIINDFRKNIPSHLSSLSIKTESEPGMVKNYGTSHYKQAPNHNGNYRVRNNDGHKSDRSLGRNVSNNSAPSLWVSGFSETTSQVDLHNLFLPLDDKLSQDLVVHRGHYAFINFKDPSAAESAQSRCWNLNGEILETNVRYPRT